MLRNNRSLGVLLGLALCGSAWAAETCTAEKGVTQSCETQKSASRTETSRKEATQTGTTPNSAAQKPTLQPVALTKPAVRPVMVMIGSTSCFWLRASDGAETPQKRYDRITDVFNKYLGGSKATFTVKPVGKKTGIFINNDLAVTVTPEDVKAAKAKSVAALAGQWKSRLAKAFDETKAVK